MKAFLCHSSANSKFVIEVAKHLERNLDGVFYYEEHQRADEGFETTINHELQECEVMVVFVGDQLTKWQITEVKKAFKIHESSKTRYFLLYLLEHDNFPSAELEMLDKYPRKAVEKCSPKEALLVAADATRKVGIPFLMDGLPLNPHLFDYEKDIIDHFDKVNLLDSNSYKSTGQNKSHSLPKEDVKKIRDKWLDGSPATWPEVVCWTDNRRLLKDVLDAKEFERWKSGVGQPRKEGARVIAASLSKYHKPKCDSKNTEVCDSKDSEEICMVKQNFCFPEAGPREFLYFPQDRNILRVAILVSGGIAPGINAVIDGIVQRHHSYANMEGYGLEVVGLKNGFRAFDNIPNSQISLDPIYTSSHANEGGSILGTSRVDELLDIVKRPQVLNPIVLQLFFNGIDILYIIGGDGSMKAAHAIWTVAQELSLQFGNRKLSIVTIPKTMDNDILWVWQAFGFLSAVEKAREVIEHLITEVEANPRLCVAQLFGSDSGFVVSHTVLATRTKQCDVALIPEVKFTMKKLAAHMMEKMCGRPELIPRGLVVMAETAIPLDAMDFVDDTKPDYIDIDLSKDEKKAIRDFDALRNKGLRIQGQTNDALRSAGLKIVSRGLHVLLRDPNLRRELRTEMPAHRPQSYWNKLRTFTNEPRHLLRAIPPSCTDIIMGNRLGTLAVDNAIAGYTDFMISQWLTEYVLVPLELVVLGRKRIPKTGIFWKSTISKTGQPAKLF